MSPLPALQTKGACKCFQVYELMTFKLADFRSLPFFFQFQSWVLPDLNVYNAILLVAFLMFAPHVEMLLEQIPITPPRRALLSLDKAELS